jgi:hypothetical protein
MTSGHEQTPRPANGLRWYDSLWLGDYFAAQAILRREAPQRLEAFEDAMRVFRCPPDYKVEVSRGFFDRGQLEQARAIVRSIPKERLEMHELGRFGRFVVHDWPQFTALQQALVDRVSQMAGEAVEPSYNFLSLYTHKGVCEPHLDAPIAKWTLDICLDQSAPWPIHYSRIVDWPAADFEPGEDWREAIRSDSSLGFRSETLEPGDALLFTGPNQWHYRDPYAEAGGKPHCDLLFFHFVPKGTLELVRPDNWARLFGVPALAALGNRPKAPRVTPR